MSPTTGRLYDGGSWHIPVEVLSTPAFLLTAAFGASDDNPVPSCEASLSEKDGAGVSDPVVAD